VITSGSTGTTGSSGTTATSGTTGTTGNYTGPTENSQSNDDNKNDKTSVIVLGTIVGSAALVGLVLFVIWLVRMSNKAVPEELRDVGETNRLYDRA